MCALFSFFLSHRGFTSQMERAAYVGRVATELSLGQAFLILDNFDFGDSGAFAEIHVPQFPGGMGREVLQRSRGQKVSAVDSMRLVSRHHNVTSTTSVSEVPSTGRGLWSGAASGPTLSITAGGGAATSSPSTSGALALTSTTAPSPDGGALRPIPAGASAIAGVLHRARDQHLKATKAIERQHGGGSVEAEAPMPSYSSALVLPTGVVLPPPEMTAEEETQIRKENGGLLVVHTAQSALQTKHFTSEELAKPTEEETKASLERTKRAIQTKLDEMLNPTGVGTFKVKREAVPTSSALVLHGGDTTTETKVVVENALDPFAPTNRKALKLDRSELVTVEDADPAPIIRSPTAARRTHGGFAEAMAAAEKKLVSVPAAVNNYRNKNGQIFSLEERIKAEGGAAPKANVLTQSHKDVVMGLRRAQQEHEIAAAEREKAHQEEEERKRLDQDRQATEMAKKVIASRAAAAAGRSVPSTVTSTGEYEAHPSGSGPIGFGDDDQQSAQGAVAPNADTRRETREERLERIKRERESRAREREAKFRVNKLEATARRLGITLEALESDQNLMSKIDRPSGVGGVDTAFDDNQHDAHEIFDARVHAKLASGEDGGGGGANRSLYIKTSGGGYLSGGGGSAMVGVARVKEETKRIQELRESGEQALQPLRTAPSSSDDDDDDDPLNLKKIGHKRARDD